MQLLQTVRCNTATAARGAQPPNATAGGGGILLACLLPIDPANRRGRIPRNMNRTLLLLGLFACQPTTAIVARIDGVAITQRELEDSVKGRLQMAEAEYKEKVHDLKVDALEQMIDDRLVARKAKAAGLTPEALLDREVAQKVQVPTDAELRGLYESAKDSGRELPPFDDIKGEIAKFIKDKKIEQASQAYHEKLRTEAKIENLLPAADLPRVEVAATGPMRGTAGAPVTIVEFSDYQCPYCGRAEPTIKRILQAYAGKVRIVYRDFPLPGHDNAPKAAEAAHCAADQGKYWEMHDKMFDEQRALEIPNLKAYGRAVGVDGTKFDACLDGGVKSKDVEASARAGTDVGVHATPAFFINGRPLSGALPFESFQQIIDAELKIAK
jgi:protein-disulfide isomerase